jgi:uncharacterized protein (DUF1330 family)
VRSKLLLLLLSISTSAVIASCGSDDQTEAQQLQARFGFGQQRFSETALEALLNFEDQSSAVTLVQFIEVHDTSSFAQYEIEINDVWNAAGADAYFSSEVFGRMISERNFTSVRAIEFPNVSVFLKTLKAPEFKAAMNTLFAASGDHAWVLGRAVDLPFEPSGSYTNPDLQNLNAEEAESLLRAASESSSRPDEDIAPDEDIIIDMIVSDDPSPFWMANLIDFYEKANYPDDPESTLTGREANDIYAQSIVPNLIQYNSLPELVLDVDIVLTADDIEWEQAVLQRYASRDAFLTVFPLNPLIDAAIEHKLAGVQNTIVLATEKP